MSRSRTTILSALTVLALGVTACSAVDGGAGGQSASSTQAGDTQQRIKPGGTLRVAINAEPGNLDPVAARSLVSQHVIGAMCEKLYDINESGGITPQLADGDPKVSSDQLQMDIKIRTGLSFSDGTPLDAEAVKFTLDRNKDRADSPRRSDFAALDSVEVLDPATVRLHLKKPFSPMLGALTYLGGMPVSPKAAKANEKAFADAPVCVGPFVFDKRTAQTNVLLKKNTNYYDAANVHLDGVEFQVVPDSNIRVANLRSGNIQVVDQVPPSSLAELQAMQNSLKVSIVESFGYYGITVNMGNRDGVGKPPARIDSIFNDQRVRKALDLAINREALVRTIFSGVYTPACGPISPESTFTSPEAQKCTEANPAEAKKLLEQTGLPMPVKFDLMIPATPDQTTVGEAIQAMGKEAGFDIRLNPMEFAAALKEYNDGRYTAFLISWSGRPDPDGNMTNLFGTLGAQNNGGYSNPKFDEAVTAAQATTEVAVRSKEYARAIGVLKEDVPVVYIYRPKVLTGMSNKVTGVRTTSDGVIRVTHAGFVE